MKKIVFLGVSSWALGWPLAVHGADLAVPAIRAPEERKDPEFRRSPENRDLRTAVRYLGDIITDPTSSKDDVAGIDFFLTGLQKQLRQGNDVPRDRILDNAGAARETLRLAYNDLLAAQSPLLSQARDTVKEVAASLSSLLGRNRGSVLLLRSVADSAQATASAMTLEPPGSPGQEVPVALLCGITSIEPEVKALREKLKLAAKDVQKAKSLAQQAGDRAALVDELARKAGMLDEQAVGRLNERRTRGQPVQYQTPLRSRAVIMNANGWLKRAVEVAEGIAELLEAQLDPGQEGIRKAVDLSLAADVKTQNGKVLEEQSGQRINFNHALRLNDAILNGWKAAAARRKPWWVGRARMAKSEALQDAAKMGDAHRDAEQAALRAEGELQAGLAAIDRIDRLLGPSEAGAHGIAKRVLDVPAPTAPLSRARPPSEVRSKGLKIPHTLNVTAQEINDAFDGRMTSAGR